MKLNMRLSVAQVNVLVGVIQMGDGHYRADEIQPNTLKSLVRLGLIRIVDGRLHLKRGG